MVSVTFDERVFSKNVSNNLDMYNKKPFYPIKFPKRFMSMCAIDWKLGNDVYSYTKQ